MEGDIVTQDSLPQPAASRRATLAAVGLAGLAAALSACGAAGRNPGSAAGGSGSPGGGGATYTSEGYVQSLQSALDKAGG
jgi:hypothetical protein